MRFVPKLALTERIESELAKLLKERREAIPLSKSKAAQDSGVAIMTVYFVEEEERSPGIQTLLKMAKPLKEELWELLREATERAKKAEERERRR